MFLEMRLCKVFWFVCSARLEGHALAAMIRLELIPHVRPLFGVVVFGSWKMLLQTSMTELKVPAAI